jgi:ADP-heptose:LPS heptosyltransferase
MHLAFLRLSALGDILRVLPAWSNLHEAFPGARIQAVVEDRHAFLLEPFPWLEPVLVDRKALSSPRSALAEFKDAASRIRGAEASLDFHGILKSAIIPRLAGIHERWGDGATREGAAWFQTHPLPRRSRSRYQQALGLAGAFGESRGAKDLDRFHPALAGVELPDPGPVWDEGTVPRVVLVPGASRRGAIKRWPLRHWVELAGLLKGRRQVRWSLGPEEEELRGWLPEATGVPALPRLRLWELASVLRQADLVVAPDTGILHLSVVLGVQVLGLYGSSDPVIAGIPPGSGRILRTGLPCSPCRERNCRRLQCMEELSPARVLAALP